MQNDYDESSSDNDYVPYGYSQHIESKKLEKDEQTAVDTNNDSQKYNMPTDLQYKNLLESAFIELRTLKESNDVCKFRLPLEVKKDGSNKTMMNLVEIANILNRDSDHLLKYIMNELLTGGSLNQEGKLTMRGRYTKVQIQEILRGYIDVFVMCKSCFTAENTDLIRDNKMMFLKCNKCNAMRHVGFMVEGYKSAGRISRN